MTREEAIERIKARFDKWALDDEEAATLHESRKGAFSYMVKMVNDYGLPGELALTEGTVADLVDWKNNENVVARIRFLESNQKIYQSYGGYWLILADAYYNNGEFKNCLELAIYMLKTLGLYEDVSYRFSQWDPNDREKYIGTQEQWDEAQGIMKRILDHLELPYEIGIGEAAFYGPKLDIQIRNVYGKEDTLITIQIDQMLAEKFGMKYVDKDGTKKNPYIIHRTSIGCYERTLALLIEKYAGAFPMWLAPVQVKLLPIADRHIDALKEVEKKLQAAGIRCEIDTRSEKIGYKIREAQLEKVPYMLLMGDKDIENGTVSVRSRKLGDIGAFTAEDFIAKAKEEIDSKAI